MLYYLAEVLRLASIGLWPIIPDAAGKMWKQIGQSTEISKQGFSELKWGLTKPGTKISKGTPLFPRR